MKNPSVYLILSASAVALSLSASADKGVRKAGELKNILIEGVSRIQMRGDKPLNTPTLNSQKPLGDFLGNRLKTANPIDRMSPDIPVLLPSPVASDVVLSPWRRNLIFPPVLDFSVESPPNVRIMHWRFVVTDDQGKVFRLIKGKNKLPEHISWDGLGDDGSTLRVGHPYAYSVNVLDRAGVPTYLSGKSVRMSSYVYETPGIIVVSISPEVLFDKGYEISPRGRDYLQETRDALRKAWNRSMTIHVYGLDSDLAYRQADSVRKHLEAALHLSAGRIGGHGHPLGKDKYARLEIIVK